MANYLRLKQEMAVKGKNHLKGKAITTKKLENLVEEDKLVARTSDQTIRN